VIEQQDRELHAPDLIEPVVGFREWRIRDGQLVSPYVDLPWEAGPLRATCLPRSDRVRVARGATGHREPAPAPQCACGIYAYFEPYRREWSPAYGWLVAGAVILWGRIEVHRGGMRAEYARAAALALPSRAFPIRRRLIKQVAERLEVEVVSRGDLRDAALRHGRPIPSALLPR
jgi:hypothetical protein